MPVVSVKKDRLFEALGKKYTTKEFEDLCFAFGVEVDEDREEDGSEVFKFEIGANRYDLLCEEGIARAFNIFLGRIDPPVFTAKKPENPIHMTVYYDETSTIRPYVVCAVLRNIEFNDDTFQNFIQLQDKLHQNICRKRTLVAVGTHDLDTLTPPFRYRALPPKEIVFVPLAQEKAVNGEELMEIYDKDIRFKHLKPYCPIIKDSPRYPVLYDSKDVVLSLPPLINGEHSKMSAETKNVFIECTATDLTKAQIVLNTMVTMFSEYTEKKFEVEQVEVEYIHLDHLTPMQKEDFEKFTMGQGKDQLTPTFEYPKFEVTCEYINKKVGVHLNAEEICKCLKRMALVAEPINNGESVRVTAPPTRSDVLHKCDIMEDVGIAFGFDNIPKTTPNCSTIGKAFEMNHLCDLLRQEIANAGFTEALTLSLCSYAENYTLLRKDEKNPEEPKAVRIANPKTFEFEIARTSLLPGLLKNLGNNLSKALPQKYFEVSDVVMQDQSVDVGAKNVRNMCAIYADTKKSGFEEIHGLLDRVMDLLEVPFILEHVEKGAAKLPRGYYIKESKNDQMFFPGRAATVLYVDYNGKLSTCGYFGILHPKVLDNFGLTCAVSVLEIDLEKILELKSN